MSIKTRNGKLTAAAAQEKKQTVLCYPLPDKSPLSRCSVSSGRIVKSASSHREAENSLWQSVVAHVKKTDSVSIQLDNIDLENLIAKCSNQLQASSLVTETINDQKQFAARRKLLSKLNAKNGFTQFEDENRVVAQEIEAAFEKIQDALHRVADLTPWELPIRCDQVTEYLDQIEFPAGQFERLQTLTSLFKLTEFIQRDPNAVPVHKKETILSEIYQQTTDHCVTILDDLIIKLMQPMYAKQVSQLRALMTKLQKRGSCTRLDEVSEWLQKGRLLAPVEKSCLINVPGPTAQMLINELAQLYFCDLASLPGKLTDELLQQLHQHVVETGFVEMQPEWGPILESCSVEELADVFEKLFSATYQAGSVYAAISQHGVQQAATDLLRLSQPFVQLIRNHISFNVEVSKTAILHAPEPTSEQDQQILTELLDRLEQQFAGGIKCVFSSSVHEVRLVRCLSGFSTAIESLNQDLFETYVESRKSNHRCHLFGVVPDSPNGQASQMSTTLHQSLYEPGENNHG